jgi:RNA-binding protein Musashi
MFDRETGRSKGFAFATFADEQTVGIAMNASGIELEGKPVGYYSSLRVDAAS